MNFHAVNQRILTLRNTCVAVWLLADVLFVLTAVIAGEPVWWLLMGNLGGVAWLVMFTRYPRVMGIGTSALALQSGTRESIVAPPRNFRVRELGLHYAVSVQVETGKRLTFLILKVDLDPAVRRVLESLRRQRA
jgi:hypothetical protein